MKMNAGLKRLTSIALTFVLVVGLAPSFASPAKAEASELAVATVSVTAGTQLSAKSKAASNPTATVKKAKKGTTFKAGNLKYKVTKLAGNESTVTVIGLAKKKATKLTIPSTVTVKSKKGANKGTFKYKVTAIASKAFQKNKKIKSVKIGANVKTIGSRAFYKCKVLKSVKLGKAVKKISSYAFAESPKLAEVTVPYFSNLTTIGKGAFKNCKKLKSMNLDNAKKLKSVHKTAFEGTLVRARDVRDYSYEVVPLMEPFNEYFYIKTDNPDPESFRFVDKTSKYAAQSKSGSITPLMNEYADVLYEVKDTYRVKGGYLAYGSSTDGGSLTLQEAKVTGSHEVYNVSTGKSRTEKEYKYTDTKKKVKVKPLVDEVDYLINTYGSEGGTFFDRMDAIESGFAGICFYTGVGVLGTLKKDADAQWGISTSPHTDQNFYIQDPYYRDDDGMPMFVSSLYPFRYDSLGFPSMMASVAKRMDPSATYEWTETHYLIEVTYGGETRTYGGAGSGGGQGIRKQDVKYIFRFDGSPADAAADITLSSLGAKIEEYGAMDIPEDVKEGEITWSDVAKTVGDGSYVKVVVINSIFGLGTTTGFAYLYDDGYDDMPSYMSNVWFDGRYFNKHEYFYEGASFEQTVADVQPDLVFKDFKATLPNDGNSYELGWYQDLDSCYDAATGTWAGYTTFRYDEDSKTWTAFWLDALSYYSEDDYQRHYISDAAFVDACTITMDEALQMNLDANTNVEPTSYYSYDMVEKAGTRH